MGKQARRAGVWVLVVAQAVVIVALLWSRAPSLGPAVPGDGAAPPESREEARPPLDATVPISPAPDSRRTAASEPVPASTTPTALEANAGGDRSPPIGTVVYGEIRAADGGALPELWLNGVGPDGRRVSSMGPVYALAGLTPGVWTLSCREQGWIPLEHHCTVTAGQAPTRLDLTLTRATVLRIRFVTPDGVPAIPELAKISPTLRFQGITAVATVAPLPPQLPPTLSRNQGRIGVGEFIVEQGPRHGDRVPQGWDALLALREPPPVHVSAIVRHFVVATERVEPGTAEVTLRVSLEEVRKQLATVRVRILDADTGDPIPDAGVSFSDRQSSGPGPAADATGWFVSAEVLGGPMLLRVRTRAHGVFSRAIAVEPGGTLNLGEFRLGRAHKVRGQVVDAAGQGVAAQLDTLWLGLPLTPPLVTGAIGVRTDGEGHFEVHHLPRGRNLLRVVGRDSPIAAVIVDTTSGPVEDLRIVLRPGTPVSLHAHPDTLGTYLVALRDAADVPVWGDSVGVGPPHTLHLPPGSYGLERAWEDGRPIDRRTIEVKDAPLRIELGPAR